jgi:hypothetical protein
MRASNGRSAMGALATHHEFTLPLGYVDASGEIHADGTIRLATARDEIEPLQDAEVRRNEAYLGVLLLSRTVVRIGQVTDVTTDVIQDLFAADFDHLQRLYERLNTNDSTTGSVVCPDCRRSFQVDLERLEARA